MRVDRIITVIRRHCYETLGHPDRLSDMLLWPLLDVVSWGFFSRYLLRGHADFAPPAQLVSGIVLWGVFRGFQRDIAVGFLAEIWSRNLVGLFITPLSFPEYVTGLALFNFCKSGVLLGLIIALCEVSTGMPSWSRLAHLLGPLAILFVFGAAIGLFVTALILRFSTRVQSLAYGLAGVLFPLSCVFYPLSALPAPLQQVAALLPTTQAFEAMRRNVYETRLLLQGGCGALIGFALSTLFFRAALRTMRRNGRMARMD